MSELADRLEAAALEPIDVGDATLMREAARELRRLADLLGPAAYQTDAKWSHDLVEVNVAECALVEARGYWETQLILTSANRLRSAGFTRL